MAKCRSSFIYQSCIYQSCICQSCGAVTPRRQDKCEACGAWNSIIEEVAGAQ